MSRAAGFSPTLWTRLRHLPSPVVVVVYDSSQSLDESLEEVAVILGIEPDSSLVTELHEAIARPNEPLLFPVPLDRQEQTLSQLALLRDRLSGRAQPLVFFLPRDGAGLVGLARSPFLASWLRGRILDPAMDERDLAQACVAFEVATGLSPEGFLSAWSRGELPDDLDYNLWHGEALHLAPEASG